MRRRLLLAALIAVIVPATCAASAGADPIADCNANDRLTQHYTVPELRHALAVLPADIKEYTDCYDVLQRALLAELSKSGGGSGGSGGSFLPTPVLIIVIVLVVAAAALGAVALRRRQ